MRAQRRNGGHFILQAEIARRGPRAVSDVLDGLGMNVVGHPYLGGELFMKRFGCAPTVYIDGIKVTHHAKGDTRAPREALEAVNLFLPSEVEGIEVYAGPASVPAEFAGSSAGCGVVAIWGKRG
jgi:hypothetical protein